VKQKSQLPRPAMPVSEGKPSFLQQIEFKFFFLDKFDKSGQV
jgi:hypothetical protein